MLCCPSSVTHNIPSSVTIIKFLSSSTHLLGRPDSLVVGVVDHGRLPLAVHLVVPVLWLGGVRVRDVLGLVPVLWLLVVRVRDGRPLVPILGLLRFRVLGGIEGMITIVQLVSLTRELAEL